MRPYLAVLKDSVREALASRILWLLTGLITLILLLGFAPFALEEEAAARFQRNEFRNGPEFLKLLAAQDRVRESTAARRIWLRLPESVRHRVSAVDANNVKEQVEILFAVRGELNGMLNNDDLYDPAAWPPKKLPGEAKRLLDRGVTQLSPEEKRRLNRLLIDSAFPEHILPVAGKSLHAVWFGYKLGTPLPFEPKQLPLLVKFALAVLTTFLAGILGVLISILVTAPIVPQTFEPGAVDLLLSKPVSRTLLFLTKFFGASTFILLNAVYLIGGMWLIAGLRFEIWSARLLLCIPVLLFLFVIYYSVSALTGVIWRNAIVSVCCTAIFWGLCFTVGTAKNVAESAFIEPAQLGAIVPAGDKLLAVNRQRQTFEWSPERKTWEEVFRGGSDNGTAFFMRDNLLGPVYDPKFDRLCAIESIRTRFDFFGGAGKFFIGPRKEDWRRIETAVTPGNPEAMFVDANGQILLVCLSGIYRLEGDATVEHRPFKILGVDIAPHDRSVGFARIGPPTRPKWQKPFSAAFRRSDGALAICARDQLIEMAADQSGNYDVAQQIELESDRGATLAFVGERLAVGTADGHVRLFGGTTAGEETEIPPHGNAKPRAMVGSPDGRCLAVLGDDRRLSVYDVEMHQPLAGQIVGQGEISAVTFSPKNRLMVADGFGRVTEYGTQPLEPQATFKPSADLLEILYRYVVTPLYTVFPKPGELDAVVQRLVVGEPVDLFDEGRQGREEPTREKLPEIDIWKPIWSNVAFLTVMLTITCVYIARRDF